VGYLRQFTYAYIYLRPPPPNSTTAHNSHNYQSRFSNTEVIRKAINAFLVITDTHLTTFLSLKVMSKSSSEFDSSQQLLPPEESHQPSPRRRRRVHAYNQIGAVMGLLLLIISNAIWYLAYEQLRLHKSPGTAWEIYC
jgi:hypothetical protein